MCVCGLEWTKCGCVCVRAHVCVCVCVCACTYASVQQCSRPMHACMYACVSECAYLHTHTRKHTHTYTRAHTDAPHTCAPAHNVSYQVTVEKGQWREIVPVAPAPTAITSLSICTDTHQYIFQGCHWTFATITENLRVRAVSQKMNTKRDWNHLEENIVKAGSASAFTSALSRSTPPAS